MATRPTCLWDYVSVMYRHKSAPPDPREWMLRTRWLYAPTHLARDIREGRWRRLSPRARLALGVGAALYLALVIGLLSLIPLALTGFAPLHRLSAAGSLSLRIVPLLILLPFLLWPAAWAAWIAIGGPDRATAVLRRERTRIANAPDDAELATRLAYWKDEISQWPNHRFNRHRQWLDPEFAAINLCILGAALSAMLFFNAFANPMIYGAIYPVIFAMLYWGSRRRKAIQKRLIDALDALACPDCAYPLTGLPGRPPDHLLPTWPGPRRCPECGSPWPALPPPVPAPEFEGAVSRAAGEFLSPIFNAGLSPTKRRPGSPQR